MLTLYLMRHGQTDLNIAGRMQGQMATSLNEEGRSQAEEAAAFIKERGLKFDKIYVSPLPRAVETAQLAVGEEHGPFIEDKRIMEWSFGPYEGAFFKELPKDALEFIHNPEDLPTPDGMETLASMRERVQDFLSELAEKEVADGTDKKILVVSHGLFLRATLSELLSRRWNELLDLWFNNCSICEIHGFGEKGPCEAVMIYGKEER